MTPRYGRAYGSHQAVSYAPYIRGNKITMISAISIAQVETAMYGEWSANGEIFMHFLDKYLCPLLKPNHVVVMDNVGFHKMQSIQDKIKSTGARLAYQPPYHPELNPIEEMWSMIKILLRKFEARNQRAFQKSIKKAFEAVTKSDLQGWFQHAGL